MAIVLIEGHKIHRHVAVYDVGNEVRVASSAKGSCQSCGRWRCLWWGRVFDDAMCSDRKHGGGNKGLRNYCCSEEKSTSKVGSA